MYLGGSIVEENVLQDVNKLKADMAVLENICSHLKEAIKDVSMIVASEKKRLNGNLEKIYETLRNMDENWSSELLDVNFDWINKLNKIYNDITELKIEHNKKPSWFVTAIITSLSSLVVGLATFILTSK